jgi:heme a synthase
MRRVPRRTDLVWLSWGLVAGVFGQAILGKFTVEFDLNPVLVASHFLLSIVLVTDAVVLHHRASLPDSRVRSGRSASPQDTRIANALLVVALLVLVAGTVVTGTGPHGGDETAHRFQLVMTDVVRVHSILVWVLVALTVVLAVRTRERAVVVLLAIEVAQGAIGYTQYFMGVPPLLVAVHVIGALAVWISALRVRIAVG